MSRMKSGTPSGVNPIRKLKAQLPGGVRSAFLGEL
jgi:hypothetical protein